MVSKDLILLLHPIAAVIFVFPLLGIVINRALLVRKRRLEDKSKIPATVGQEHVQLGRWLTGSVVGIVLLALANDVFGNIIQNDVWGKEPFKVAFIGLMFGGRSPLSRSSTKLKQDSGEACLPP